MTASQAVRRIREGSLSSKELVAACLDQIAATDSVIGAWAHIDPDQALAQAEVLDDIRRKGRPMGALHGIPVGLKDIIDTKDFPTECGTPINKGRRPDRDAAVVERLIDAGAVILGKTVTTEFAFLNPAGTRNPHDLERTPGGSSSGSAAGVAAGHVPIAIGTQTNGSVIRPASFCGVYGFKPTSGVISRRGILPTSRSLDQVGVFARSLEDAALLADVLAAYDAADDLSYARPRPKMLKGYESDPPVEPRLAWFDLPFAGRLDKDAAEGFESVLDLLGEAVERIPSPPAFGGLVEVQRIIHEYEIVRHLEAEFRDHWSQISPALQAVVERGRSIKEEIYRNALTSMRNAIDYFNVFFRDYDAVITPAATGQAPPIAAGGTGDPVFCTIWTVAGLPCVTMPVLVGENGLPVGLQLVGTREQDDRLMRTARWLLQRLQTEQD